MAGESPAVILYDPSGNPVAVEDGIAVPANNKSLLVAGKHVTDGKAYQSTMIDDTDVATQKRMMVEAELKPGTSVTIGAPIPTSLGNIVTDFVRNGGSRDLIVDGSGPAVVFTFPADATDNIRLTELRIVITAGTLDFDGASFGKGSALTNGVLIEVDVGGVSTTLANLTINEEILILPSRSGVLLDLTGTADIIAASYDLGGAITLAAASADEVRVTVQDDITGAAYGFDFFTMAVYGVKVTP